MDTIILFNKSKTFYKSKFRRKTSNIVLSILKIKRTYISKPINNKNINKLTLFKIVVTWRITNTNKV